MTTHDDARADVIDLAARRPMTQLQRFLEKRRQDRNDRARLRNAELSSMRRLVDVELGAGASRHLTTADLREFARTLRAD